MARPVKWRKVCCVPEFTLFGPITGGDTSNVITMALEEYETIRLIDFEGLTQEECSERMKVARTTVQKIYKDAREKMARVLVDGNSIRIEGGDYQLYNDMEKEYGCRRCRRRRMGQNQEGFGPGRGFMGGQGRGFGYGRHQGRFPETDPED